MASNFPDANGNSRWETCDIGCPFLLETLIRIGISKFRSSCLGVSFIDIPVNKAQEWAGCKKKAGPLTNLPEWSSGDPKGRSFSCQNPVGVEEGIRLQKAGNGWDGPRVALLLGSPQLEYWTTTNCLQSHSWTPYLRLLSPALKDYLTPSLSHLLMSNLLAKQISGDQAFLSWTQNNMQLLNSVETGSVYVTHHCDLGSKHIARPIR